MIYYRKGGGDINLMEGRGFNRESRYWGGKFKILLLFFKFFKIKDVRYILYVDFN